MAYKGFADGIRQIVFNNLLREQMGKYNINVSKQFAIEKSLEKLCEVYRELLHDGK